jgi:hypothetical protein
MPAQNFKEFKILEFKRQNFRREFGDLKGKRTLDKSIISFDTINSNVSANQKNSISKRVA